MILQCEDPIEYFRQIWDIGARAGICKIIPPPGWELQPAQVPSDALIETRLQEVHKLRHRQRGPNAQFMSAIEQRYRDREPGAAFPPALDIDCPTKDGVCRVRREIDLYHLFAVVGSLGGLPAVDATNAWDRVVRKLSLPNTREAREFARFMYVIHFRDMKETRRTLKGAITCQRCGAIFPESTSIKRSVRNHGPGEAAGWVCADECAFGYGCGGSTTIAEYRLLAKEWKSTWLQSREDAHPSHDAAADWRRFESEFWRIVEDPHRAVHVRYGSDLDTGHVGSGFPRPGTESHLADEGKLGEDGRLPLGTNPWNLNILPLACGSLLKYLPSCIKGISVPWLYCGSLFTTFCYHTEDLNMMSLNYMHEADENGGKVWYGAPPGPGALAFEAAFRSSVPDLVEVQPDLEYELVTMISPIELQRRGADICRSVQRPGEFILTFPQSFHGGFSLGYNVAEAVNFFTSECLPWMRAGMRKCRMYKRPPVFGFTQFLVTVGSRLGLHADLTARDAELIAIELRIECDLEAERRLNVHRHLFQVYEITCDTTAQGDDCSMCRQPCYLSALTHRGRPNEQYCLSCVVENGERFRAAVDSASSRPYVLHNHVELRQLEALVARAKRVAESESDMQTAP